MRLAGSKFPRLMIGDGPGPTLVVSLSFQGLFHSFRATTERARPRPGHPHIPTPSRDLRRRHSETCLAPRQGSSDVVLVSSNDGFTSGCPYRHSSAYRRLLCKPVQPLNRTYDDAACHSSMHRDPTIQDSTWSNLRLPARP